MSDTIDTVSQAGADAGIANARDLPPSDFDKLAPDEYCKRAAQVWRQHARAMREAINRGDYNQAAYERRYAAEYITTKLDLLAELID